MPKMKNAIVLGRISNKKSWTPVKEYSCVVSCLKSELFLNDPEESYRTIECAWREDH